MNVILDGKEHLELAKKLATEAHRGHTANAERGNHDLPHE